MGIVEQVVWNLIMVGSIAVGFLIGACIGIAINWIIEKVTGIEL